MVKPISFVCSYTLLWLHNWSVQISKLGWVIISSHEINQFSDFSFGSISISIYWAKISYFYCNHLSVKISSFDDICHLPYSQLNTVTSTSHVLVVIQFLIISYTLHIGCVTMHENIIQTIRAYSPFIITSALLLELLCLNYKIQP